MSQPNPTYDASPCHYGTVPIGALSDKSHALQNALAENERLQQRGDTYRRRAISLRHACVAERERSINYESTIGMIQAAGIRKWKVRATEAEAKVAELQRENERVRRMLDNAQVGGKESDG